eukprot:12886989-Prorocentrum_lima.AAC.1
MSVRSGASGRRSVCVTHFCLAVNTPYLATSATSTSAAEWRTLSSFVRANNTSLMLLHADGANSCSAQGRHNT